MPLSKSERRPQDTEASNPFKSPDVGQIPSTQTTWPYSRRIIFLLAAAAIGSVPCYGFYVHAARDPQVTAILIALCWLLTLPCAIGSILLAAIRPPRPNSVRWFVILLTIYLIVAVFVGWNGVGSAITELLAG